VSRERLFGWHAALFPTGYSCLAKIKVGGWRDDASGPMQVVSGPIGRQRVHFEAPPADRLAFETRRFLDWLNGPSSEPPLLKAGLGHLWFVTLHPFDDGNGRIARAIGDLLLARADGSPQRFYSLSSQIERERKAYYDILERSQKRSLDVTEWLAWFLATGSALGSGCQPLSLADNADLVAVGIEHRDAGGGRLVLAAVALVLITVAQQVAVDLLDVVLGDGDLRPRGEDGRDDLRVAGHFQLIA